MGAARCAEDMEKTAQRRMVMVRRTVKGEFLTYGLTDGGHGLAWSKRENSCILPS